MNLNFRRASKSDAGTAWELMQQAKAQMAREGKRQWDEHYPTPTHIADDISAGHAYVLDDGQQVLAYGAVVFSGEPAYNTISGKWLSLEPYVVVHRLAVAEAEKGKGLATAFMEHVERLAASRGIHSFKVDTNYDNQRMQRVLEKCGFSYCGNVEYPKGSRMAYEKLI